MKQTYRLWVMGVGAVLVLLALALTDPDRGVSTAMLALKIVSPLLVIGLAHFTRKAFLPYVDMQEYAVKAKEHPIGAAIVFLGTCLLINATLGLFGKAIAEELPKNAQVYAPMLKAEQMRYWANHPAPETLAGLAEQESCISLKSSRCWSPKSQLKSDREEGAGIGQITRAYRADGGIRFDSLAQMRKAYPDLRDMTWDNIYQQPQLQLRALVLLVKENYNRFPTSIPAMSRLHFADAAYNGGGGGVQSERRACGLIQGCDANQWFGNVELHCLKSKVALYGKRNACDINREHPHNVFLIRSAKYHQVMV